MEVIFEDRSCEIKPYARGTMVVCYGTLSLEVAKEAKRAGVDRICLNFTSVQDIEHGALEVIGSSLREAYVLGNGSALQRLAGRSPLRLLQIYGDPRESFYPVDEFPLLEELEVTWPTKRPVELELPKLRNLRLQKLNTRNGEPVLRLPSLMILELIDAYANDFVWLPPVISLSIQSPRGLAESLSLGAARTFVKELVLTKVDLRYFLAETQLCKSLRSLELNSCGRIRSLSWLKRLPSLERVVIGGTTFVEDGDLSHLDHLDQSQVWFRNRRHYNRRRPQEARSVLGVHLRG